MVNMSLIDDATCDYPAIVEYFDKQGIQIEIDGQHPTGEDCIFDKTNGAWLGYASMFCNTHKSMDCEVCNPTL